MPDMGLDRFNDFIYEVFFFFLGGGGIDLFFLPLFFFNFFFLYDVESHTYVEQISSVSKFNHSKPKYYKFRKECEEYRSQVITTR